MSWLKSVTRRALLAACAASLAVGAEARGQLIGLSDDIIVLSRGAGQQQSARRRNALGRIPASGSSPFSSDPGGRDSRLETRPDPGRSRIRYGGGRSDALGELSVPQASRRPHSQTLSPERQKSHSRKALMLEDDALELPHDAYAGPENGMTLDQAIELMVRQNTDLRSKYYEIPQARADRLTAGLRANPFYFLSASNYPYQPYTPNRPGENQYSVSVIQPIDVNHKREARSQAAASAVRVLEAQFQDAVRLALDDLYDAFIDVVVARNNLRAAQIGLAASRASWQAAQRRAGGEQTDDEAALQAVIDYRAARIRVRRAEGELADVKGRLANLTGVPPERTAQLEVRGAVKEFTPLEQSREELIRIALASRPDLASFRLGVHRSQADVRVARKEAFQDIFLVYTPWEYRNNRPTGGQNVSSFSFGLMGTIPIFDRNQGDVGRAQWNVVQTRTAMAALEREVTDQVDRAIDEYEESRDSAAELEQWILPASERLRDKAYRDYSAGRKSLSDYLNAQRDHNDVVHQYNEALIRRRRSMLRLNTAVARRVLP